MIRVLLADDQPLVRAGLNTVLASDPDLEVVGEAADGRAALAAVERLRPDVALLDIRMPGMDGFETAANIKRLDQTKDVPIIFLTGSDSDAGYAFRGYATGAADYLTKPFDPWVLRAKVTVFLELHRKNRLLERMLAREQGQFDELALRLKEIEAQMAASTVDEVHELRHQVREMRQLVRDMRRR
jgi:DNA-binding NarL/FixJ family response regulator